MARIAVVVKGVVQGVGFRPFVYSLAKSLGLKGFVANSSEGVTIEIEGDRTSEFVDALRHSAPPLAKIHSVEITSLPPADFSDFVIVESRDEGSFTHVSPDIATCDDCLREMFDPADRRYLYPFINCTNCGPRYTITRRVPYDRPHTTMAVFEMCRLCLKEYHDPRNRRFHAQPNACPVCGPRLEFRRPDGVTSTEVEGDPIAETITLLRQGGIVAVKGLGGFHLCCDALNSEAVERLRVGKRRQNKPFALMAAGIDGINRFCHLRDLEVKLLTDPRRPIVLLRKRNDSYIPEAVAPKNRYLGFMLPYTPVHHLLFQSPEVSRGDDRPVASGDLEKPRERSPLFEALVMTSGNLSEEPIVIDNDDALKRLQGVADGFLIHNRDIFMRVDDTVVRVDSNGRPSFVRRSRGFVPEAIPLATEGPEVLGCGADMKNTFALTKGSYVVPSQHIGDMENAETQDFFEETLDNLCQVYRARPVAVAHDLHPAYFSSRWAEGYCERNRLPRMAVQHHYAHIASVMAEKGLKGPVIGIALDGTGYGTDGNLWGGEFLLCDLDRFERVAHFRYFPLPGGESAIRECWRTAVSLLLQAGGREKVWDLLELVGFVARYGRSRLDTILKIAENRTFSPLSSGAGRLFDAVAALSGVCDRNTFEGEAAIALESVLSPSEEGQSYPYACVGTEPMQLDFCPMLISLAQDLAAGTDRPVISSKFHRTMVNAVADMAVRIRQKSGISEVAMSGGVFQNDFIAVSTVNTLVRSGFLVHIHEQVPPNDACISLGQAYIARHRFA